ncbi:MAG TPA: thrombospondin type 3 repeat-containing protein, partial [Bacteroidales bacterium]
HDAIVRFIRCRPGDISGKAYDAMGAGHGAHDVVFDHCSASWSIDECLSPSGSIYNITVQWCLIGESLNKSVHPKGEHGYGSLVRAIGGLTLHHNLWIDNIARNPRLGDNYGKAPWPTFDVRNNVIYNWGGICSGLTGDHLSANYVANYLKPGPNSSDRAPIVLSKTADVKYFVKDDVVEGRSSYTKNPASMFTPSEAGGRHLFTLMEKPFDVPAVKTTSAEEAYRQVLALVGAICPERDSVDNRLIREVKTNTGRIINSQNEVGGWPNYRPAEPPKDSDNDGIPDAWEKAHRMNPNDAADASLQDKDGDGYTNIEKYINSLIQDRISKNMEQL